MSFVEAGVPQGSVLGPLLFLIYINDLEDRIKFKVKSLADDTSLLSIAANEVLTADELNHDLKVIESWVFQWKMSLKPNPSKQSIELLFSQNIVRKSQYIM